MKRKILLFLVMTSLITSLHAQKKSSKEQQKLTGYAITANEKGGRSWKEVRMVDVSTGEELKSIYRSDQDMTAFNARTGQPVQKKEINLNKSSASMVWKIVPDASSKEVKNEIDQKIATTLPKKVVNLDDELNADNRQRIQVYTYTTNNGTTTVRTNTTTNCRVVYINGGRDMMQADRPFATSSAAMAYDKKHERLYYTPMGINQLRYIDLNSGKIYYFEDESFGKVGGLGDAANQITRMVMASDGNGYALTNDGRNLIRFTTGKNPEITELGEVSDADASAKVSVHSRNGYGGDMVADANKNLYLVTANHQVFKIGIDNRSAQYLGAIQGLPPGFSTNGAMVEEGSKVIVASSESTVGYYRFDLSTLQAEKVSGASDVFNASDLANGNLAFEKEKKKKDRKQDEDKVETKQDDVTITEKVVPSNELKQVDGIMVYPNPASASSVVKVSFDSQPVGLYQVQLMDLSGKLISSQELIVQNKLQVAELKLPALISGSTYFVKIFNEANRISSISKLFVQ